MQFSIKLRYPVSAMNIELPFIAKPNHMQYMYQYKIDALASVIAKKIFI